MGRRYVLVDDLDGTELPDSTPEQLLTYEGKTYRLYLSKDNLAKLHEALEPFIRDAETLSARSTGPVGIRKHDKERMKAIRAWAQENKVTFKNAAGDEVTLGDRGRIPESIVEAYDQAH